MLQALNPAHNDYLWTEVEVQCRFHHPNILRPDALLCTGAQMAVLLPWADFGTLADYLRCAAPSALPTSVLHVNCYRVVAA